MKLTNLFENIPYDPDLDFPQSTKSVIDIGDYIVHGKPFPDDFVKHDSTFMATDESEVYTVTSNDSEFVSGLVWYPLIVDYDSVRTGYKIQKEYRRGSGIYITVGLNIQPLLFTVHKIIPQVLERMRKNHGPLENIPYHELLDILKYGDDGSGADYTHETLGDFLSDVKDQFVDLADKLEEYFPHSAIFGNYSITKYDMIMRAYITRLLNR